MGTEWSFGEWAFFVCLCCMAITVGAHLVYSFYYEVIKGDPSYGGTRVRVPVYRWERRS